MLIGSEIKFNIDQTLLSKSSYIDSNFFISFPNNITSLDIELFNQYKSVIESDSTSYFSLKLIKALTSEDNLSCFITKVDYDGNILNSLDTSYFNALQNNFSTKNVVVGKFIYNEFDIIQYIITTSELVRIKLFIINLNDYYQIDYIIPYSLYEKNLKSIESSIGSLNKEIDRRETN